MDKFVINGGRKLNGSVSISGAKNASLALMPATLLASGKYDLLNTPDLRDVTTMSKLLQSMGVTVERNGSTLSLNTFRVNRFEAPYEHVKKMRASIYVLGPLLARYGHAKVSLPGGCAWGPRPVDLHIEGMKKLGAKVDLDRGYIIAKAKRLKGARIAFNVSSVGATGNILMAAVLAKGTTRIDNAAMEPEITNLAEMLAAMGAKIHGIGTTSLEIEGVDELRPAAVATIPDRIEAGTMMIAAAMCGGTVRVGNVTPDHFASLTARLEDAGVGVTLGEDHVVIKAPRTIDAVDVTTAVYPGFPTDMQAQWIAMMTVSKGASTTTDTIYRDRFNHVPELIRLGADIEMKDNVAMIRGTKRLTGTKVMSTDLRASAALILAGLKAEGTTEVLRVYHLDRGYEAIERKLTSLGASIERVKGEEF
ncbi:MAG: UDP-N-acetylglucosamine 1-carboxyvinyltransferase [Bacteroidetes bacterium]|nr:MAG: UDP-N-acetylglucosamine 1-carboxyvinyltransferase [Bacteroidota bacterium]